MASVASFVSWRGGGWAVGGLRFFPPPRRFRAILASVCARSGARFYLAAAVGCGGALRIGPAACPSSLCPLLVPLRL